MTVKSAIGGNIRRDDVKASATAKFDALGSNLQAALKRAATRGAANLPTDMGDGWLMVPTKRGPVQVAHAGARAFSL